jgi:hypothetical protein
MYVPSAVLSQSLTNEFMSKPVPRMRGTRESSASDSGIFKNSTGNWKSCNNSDRIEEEETQSRWSEFVADNIATVTIRIT